MNKDEFNHKQHFLVVTNGLDQKIIETIVYWKKNDLNIDIFDAIIVLFIQ